MSLFARLIGRKRTADAAPADERWVVLDTETTGLDPDVDDVLAIGAVAVDAIGIRVDDSFECVLRNDRVTTAENVVVHGIGHEAQRNGEDRDVALAGFRDYVSNAPCVAFHADFDRKVLKRALALAGVEMQEPAWLDLAPLAAALQPEAHRYGGRSLDDWLAAFAIDVTIRHNAAGDALATAELLLHLRAVAARQGATDFAGLLKAARQQRWLGNAD